jgi:predicted nucleic acid-binding protein
VIALIDTSVWSLALRRKASNLSRAERSAVADLTDLIAEGRARIVGVIRQEVLTGIKLQAQFEKLRLVLSPFPDEFAAAADHEAAAEASNECRSRGIVSPLVDALICAIAIRRGWSIFTTDPDFINYSKVLPIKIHTPRR